MKQSFKKAVIIVVIMSIIGCSSCLTNPFVLQDSYKEFNIKNITDNRDEDYFTSENFSFTKIDNVVVVPTVKASVYGEYIIPVNIYSKTGTEAVRIKRVILKDNEGFSFENELNEEVVFEEDSESTYKDTVIGGRIEEETMNIVDGKEYELIIEAEVDNNGNISSKTIVYEIVVIGYRSLVWPT